MVRLLVGPSVINFQKGEKLHFHGPIGALFRILTPVPLPLNSSVSRKEKWLFSLASTEQLLAASESEQPTWQSTPVICWQLETLFRSLAFDFALVIGNSIMKINTFFLKTTYIWIDWLRLQILECLHFICIFISFFVTNNHCPLTPLVFIFQLKENRDQGRPSIYEWIPIYFLSLLIFVHIL